MSDGHVHLVLGDEELLVERAVATVVAQTRRTSGAGEDLPVTRVRAGDATASELVELLSPSLFAEDRVVVFEAAGEAGKDAVAAVTAAVQDPPAGITLVVVHSGGGRAKSLVGVVRKVADVVEHDCAKVTKPAQRVDFVRNEFRTAGVRVSGEVVQAVLDAIGNDLRELAAACGQLSADTAGKVDVDAVRRYYAGKADVSGYDVAAFAVAGNDTAALESLRWAMVGGVPHVVLADALADAVFTIARVATAGRTNAYQLAGDLGMPPWKVERAQKQSRAWDRETIRDAMRCVAELNADVKGGAAVAEYAVEAAVRRVASLARR